MAQGCLRMWVMLPPSAVALGVPKRVPQLSPAPQVVSETPEIPSSWGCQKNLQHGWAGPEELGGARLRATGLGAAKGEQRGAEGRASRTPPP